MPVRAQTEVTDFDDDSVCVAVLARKATRRAAREANKAGYSVQREGGTCVVRSPGRTVKFTLKNTPIDVSKCYTFVRSAH